MIRTSGVAVALVPLLVLFAGGTFADELRFDAGGLFRDGVSERLRLATDGKAIELDEGVLIEDDGPAAGYTYLPNEEKLSPTVWARKELLLDDPRTHGATLLMAPGGTPTVRINGKPVTLETPGKAGQYWQAYSIPPDVLRKGLNEIDVSGTAKLWIARANDFAAGSLTRTTHPNRSARSGDAGQSWSRDKLGNKEDVDGEYYVRLFLDRYASRGTLNLPVIDVGNLRGRALPAPLLESGPVVVEWHGDTTAASPLVVSARRGTTPVFNTRDPWQAVSSGKPLSTETQGRYLQLRIEFRTGDPLETPRLRSLLVRAEPNLGTAWTERVTVAERQNPTIVRSSIPFRYEPMDQPRLKEIRERYRLDSEVGGARDEFELITRLAAWSSRQWVKGHLKDIYPAWNALEILKPHADGTPVGGFCQHFNVTFLQACESFGLVGRAVSLGTGDRYTIKGGGHEVVEIWSNQHQKWVYIDGQAAWYFVDQKTRLPLSLLELRERQLATLREEPVAPVEIVRIVETTHAWDGLEKWPPFLELRMIPRSNFLDQASPLPLHQGMRGWFWTGHQVWTDGVSPAGKLYSERVRSRNTWEWSLNQVQVTLEPLEKAGLMRVHWETATPDLDRVEARIDQQSRTVTSPFEWRLHAGTNTLELTAKNRAGRNGPPTRYVVDMPK